MYVIWQKCALLRILQNTEYIYQKQRKHQMVDQVQKACKHSLMTGRTCHDSKLEKYVYN